MIRYALVCAEGHAFDAWFRDSEAFESQSATGDVACASCGSAKVRKAVMAPAIRRGADRGSSGPPSPPAEGEVSPAPTPAILDDDRFQALRLAARELHARVRREAQDVGASFPDEARKIHEGDSPSRPIYGTATGEEVRSLIEDGVHVMPLPPLPEERN